MMAGHVVHEEQTATEPIQLVVVILRVLTLLLAGLIAGFFYTFSVDVNRALADVSATTYTEVQQLINARVRNWAFAAVYFPVVLLPALTLAASYRTWRPPAFRIALAGYLLYLAGGFLVTQLINIPINTALASWDPAEPPADWIALRDRWNLANDVRTIAAIGAFLCYVIAFVSYQQVDRRNTYNETASHAEV